MTKKPAAWTRHGAARKGHKTPEYIAWENMISRCTNPNFRQYKDYGGRGITVADEWRGRDGFQNFLKSVGPRPSPEMTLDRENSNKGYIPGNVRWASRLIQNRNTRKNVFIHGKTISEWCEENNLRHNTVRQRLILGWEPLRAVTQPARHMRKGHS